MSLRVLLFLLIISVSGVAQKLEKLPSDPLQAINPNELKMHLSFLASQELGGRYTLSPSFQVAAKYLATRLESYGYKGAAQGSFLQKFDVITAQADPAKSKLSLTLKGQPSEHPYGDFFNSGYVGGDVEGPIVFVGHGISSPKLNYDDYAGLDVKGKIVLIGGGTPAGLDASMIGDKEKGEDAAVAHGAVAALQIPARYMIALMRTPSLRNSSRERAMLAVDKDKKIPQIRLGPDLAELLLGAAGITLKEILQADEKHLPLQPKALEASMKLHLTVNRETKSTQNVVAVLEGTDAKLKDQYVAFSAHYDHLKTNADGRIYPGADDDGSGTVAV